MNKVESAIILEYSGFKLVYKRLKEVLEANEQPLQKGTIHCCAEGLYFHFNELQRAVAPGQFVAWYINNELLGSGPIYQ